MSKLIDLISNKRTDKNTLHTYIPIYDRLFKRFKNKDINILEIGIHLGGSIELWYEYFRTGTIYGIDSNERMFTGKGRKSKHILELNTRKRIKLYNTNAYDLDFINSEFVEKNITFDIIIDDGPHTLESQIFTAKNYSKLLKNDSILIIEDIHSRKNIPIESIISALPVTLQKKAKIFDMTPPTDNVLLITQTKDE